MSAKPSLAQYLGTTPFLTILVVFVTLGQARSVDVSLEFLGFALAFSAVRIAVSHAKSRRSRSGNRRSTTL